MRQRFDGIRYRTADGLADYEFEFVYLSARRTWRVYIVSTPPYGTRETSLHKTHRLLDDGTYYVCWTDPLRTLDGAKSVAALWADSTQVYIRTGDFVAPDQRPDIQDRSPMAEADDAEPLTRTSRLHQLMQPIGELFR